MEDDSVRIVKPAPPLAPRVLVVMPDRWPRALVRAALRDVGYDALGASTVEAALRVRAVDPDRGAVRLILVDQSALDHGGGAQLDSLLERHGTPSTLLLSRATAEPPAGPWQRVLRRPVSVAEIVSAVQTLFPLPAAGRHPLD
jgi:CheY-like chemotaxis protein